MARRKKVITTVSRPPRRRSTRVVQTIKISKKRKRNKRKRLSSVNASLRDETMLVANPCMGPISRTIGSGAVTERVRSTISGTNSATAVNGYVVWFPTYHNRGNVAASSNILYYESTGTNSVPVNSTANPLGCIGVSTTGVAVLDPASNVIGGAGAFGRGKTHAACLQLDYVGRLSDVSGQVAIIKNFPLKGMFSNDTSPVLIAPTIDQLFAYASERERLQITGHEVIWRPTDGSSVYRTAGSERPGTGGVSPDTAWTNGVAGTSQSTLSATDSDEMYGICIAWRGVPAVLGCLSINFVKVVSLELTPSGSAIESPVVSEPVSFGNPVNTITAWLDKNAPGWQSKAINVTTNVAGTLARAYAPRALSMMSNGIRGRGAIMDL